MIVPPYNQLVLLAHLQLSLSNALPILLEPKFLTDRFSVKLLFFGILYIGITLSLSDVIYSNLYSSSLMSFP